MTEIRKTRKSALRNDILMHTPEKIYEMVLSGTLRSFPYGYWNSFDSTVNASRCIKYLLEKVLNLSEKEIPEVYTVALLRKYKLYGMLVKVFNTNLHMSLDCAYEGKYKPYMLSKVPDGYWTEETAKEGVRWLIEEKLHMSKEQVKEQFSTPFLHKYGFGSILQGRSVFEVLDLAYPGEYNVWDLSYIGKGTDLSLGEEASVKGYLKAVIEELNFTPWNFTADQVARSTRRGTFSHQSPNAIYNKACEIYFEMHPSDFAPTVPMSSLKSKNVKWGILCSSPVSVYKAILDGQRSQFPDKYWVLEGGLERAAICTRYLVEDILHISTKDAFNSLTVQDFRDYRLSTMLQVLFKDSLKKALKNAYPESCSKEMMYKGDMKWTIQANV